MALYYLYPDGTTTAGASWAPTGAASIHLAIDDTQGAPDDDTTYAQGSQVTWDYFICTLAPMVDVVEITQIKIVVRHAKAGGAGASQELDFGIRIGSTNYLNGSVSPGAAYAENTKTWTTNPATSAAWTKPQLDDLSIVVGTQDTVKPTDSVRVTQVYVEVTYQPIPAGISPVREIASQRLRRYRRPLEEMSVEAGLEMLDLELMDDLSVSHPAGPNASGTGWGSTNWKRRLHQYREETIDLNRMTVSMRTRGRRGFLCTFWDSAESRRSSSAAEDGVARLTTGGTLTYERNSHQWIEDPGSRLVVQIGLNQKPIAYQGMNLDNFASNYLQHSNCSEGATSVAGLTVSGTGVNGSAFAEEASPTQAVFDSSVSGYAYKFTKGTPVASTLQINWPNTANVPANTNMRFSVDHQGAAGAAQDELLWDIQRSSDGWYWNDSTAAWSAGAKFNTFGTAATRRRDSSKVIPVGAAIVQLGLRLYIANGGTNGYVARVYHVQLEDNAWATSRVPTTASTYARAIQKYHITNTSGKRAINATCGTFMCQFIPEWAAADMNTYGGFPAFFDMTYDASNWIRLYYNSGAPNRLDFEIRASGTTYTATKPWTPVAGTTYKLAARWTSSAGELGLTARTLSVFVDGVKGTDTTRAADPTESTVDLYIGGDSAGNAVNGFLSRILFSQEVYTDEEIARFTP